MVSVRRIADRLSAGWRHFLFATIPPHSYALIRILTGVVGVATIIGAWAPAFWVTEGIMPAEGALGLAPWLTAHGLGDSAGLMLRAVLLVGYACLAAGWLTPIMAPAMFVGSLVMLRWNWLPYSAAQQLLHNLTFPLVFANSGAVWSVDAWQRRRQDTPAPPKPEPIWPLRLMQYQLALLYLSAGLWKMGSADWRSGLALHYVLNHNMYQRIPGDLPVTFLGATIALTYLTLFWELTFPLLVWFRITRPAMLAIGVLLHLGMFATMEVGAFMPTVMIPYVAFLDPERTEARVRRLLGLLRLA